MYKGSSPQPPLDTLYSVHSTPVELLDQFLTPEVLPSQPNYRGKDADALETAVIHGLKVLEKVDEVVEF
jgi:hypothetical protein